MGENGGLLINSSPLQDNSVYLGGVLIDGRVQCMAEDRDFRSCSARCAYLTAGGGFSSTKRLAGAPGVRNINQFYYSWVSLNSCLILMPDYPTKISLLKIRLPILFPPPACVGRLTIKEP
ncbi:hypothetical protein CEP54_001922 [Fusarium duplospermum]|uniref:Uncharacterized protein n=1 Tax=Fusarium duplospermum TaxID=1325734 RepID=A0A428QYN0_9HYPO|nr:hypothetical protein CEP54_001922 [Fusarium duplospermum]